MNCKEIILNNWEHYQEVVKINNRLMDPNKEKIFLKWIPLKNSFVKLNVDGTHSSKGLSGCGGIVRDDKGTCIGGFLKCIGYCIALLAELWSIHIGLKRVTDIGYSRVVVESNSRKAVELIMQEATKGTIAGNLVMQIKRQMSSFEVVEIIHNFRKTNKCAN